jgi:molybdopterin-containing oxidoreductase family membrane subunit
VERSDLGEDLHLLAPIERAGRGFRLLAAVCGAIAVWGLVAWLTQLRRGLSATGLNVPVYWGLYITHFVFFIGISHAGTLISAILRLAKAEWRRPITRAAEVITVLVLFFGMGCILLDLGRPDRLLFVFRHGNFRSPLLWDVVSVTTYLTASTIYLYLPLIPDIAILRDTIPRRRRFYRALALGYTGAPRQKRILERAISVMAVLVIPIAVSVHTVVSWVFAMTVQPMWHSTIFGPYFVVGAIFSGIAALILAMAVVRRAYRLEAWLKPVHFNNLGVLLLVMSLLWFYFTFAEFLTTYYGGEPTHMVVFLSKTEGRFSPLFWTMVTTCFVIPFALLANRRTRGTVWGTVVASISVEAGMWLERFLIVVPSLSIPRLPYAAAPYAPTWVEWSLFAAFVAVFVLLYACFTRLFPIVSVWEVREGRERSVADVTERVKGYAPGAAGSEP